MDNSDDVVELMIYDVYEQPEDNQYREVKLDTSRGQIDCRFRSAEGPRYGVLMIRADREPLSGFVYPRLCDDLAGHGIAVLLVRPRAGEPSEAALDALAGLVYLQEQGVRSHCLVGHAAGAAAVVEAATTAHTVQSVIALSAPGEVAMQVTELASDCALLFVHGQADDVAPPSASVDAHAVARGPKQLVLYEGAGHSLGEVAGDVHALLRDWIIGQSNNKVMQA